MLSLSSAWTYAASDSKAATSATQCCSAPTCGFAQLDQCDLSNAQLPLAQIGGASFNDAWLVGAKLDAVSAGPAAAPQEVTHFAGAHLERATFDGADLRGCRFYDADRLAHDQFVIAFGNRTTSGLQPGVQAPNAYLSR